MPWYDPGMARHCTHHCASCDRHFTSLDAFDRHFFRDEAGWPHCQDPAGVERSVRNPAPFFASVEGVCELSGTGGVPVPALLWFRADAVERARRRFAGGVVG